MLQKILSLFDADASEDVHLEGHDLRLASAALLLHAGLVDGEYSEDEMNRLTQLLRERFDLEREELEELMTAAEHEEREAVDLYRFTSVLARHLDQPGRQQVVGMLWEVCLADGEIHEFEDNLVRRVGDLLGVSTRDRVRMRKQAEAKL